MRRLLEPLGILITLSTAASALGVTVNDEGIISGAQLIWDGTAANTNQIYVGAGEIRINGSPAAGTNFSTGAPQFVTSPAGINFAFATDVAGGAQAANTAYYVYGANNAGVLQWVISTSAPNQGGEPWQSLTYTPHGGAQTTTTFALFVGSYITDANKNIVPFLKKGDEITLTPSVNTSSAGHQNTTWSNIVTFTSVLVYPDVLALTFPAGTTIPLTASALLVDFVMVNTDTVAHDVRVLNPTLDTDVTAGVCTANPQYYMIAGLGAAGQPWPYNHARIKTAINTQLNGSGALANAATTVEVGACTAPAAGKTYKVSGAYVGYVEVTHHLSY